MKETTKESKTEDDWFKTGDVAVCKNRNWWIVERKKELIKVNGLQVVPAELEAVLLEHEDVADATTVGITVHGEELPRHTSRYKGGLRASPLNLKKTFKVLWQRRWLSIRGLREASSLSTRFPSWQATRL